MVGHQPLWGQTIWQNLWSLDHVTGHALQTSPGVDEADTLARVQWLERVLPAYLAAWLHCHLQHVGVKTMWNGVKQWDTLTEVFQARVLCAQEHPHTQCLGATNGQVMQGCIPLTQWLVDYIGLLPKSESPCLP